MTYMTFFPGVIRVVINQDKRYNGAIRRGAREAPYIKILFHYFRAVRRI